MAKTVNLTAVEKLSTYNEHTNLIVEQEGELNRVAIADLKISSSEIYKQDEEPIDAPEGALWIDTDEKGGGGSAGVSSWNDLTDKPFGETIGVTNTLTWDGMPTEASYKITYYTLYKISDSIPSIEDIEKGYMVTTFAGYNYSNNATEINERGIILLPSSNNPWAMINPTDLEDLPKGTYLSYMEHGHDFNYITSLVFTENVFETDIVKTIESKYMPKYLQLKESIVETDTLTWDGDISGLIASPAAPIYKVSDNVPTAEDLANGYTCTLDDGQTTITNAEYPLYTDEEGVIFLGYQSAAPFIVAIVPNDETSYGQKGIYFVNYYGIIVESLTIPGYTFVIKETKLDKKYIPDTMPEVTTEDNGKFLRVVDGAWVAVSVPNAEEAIF